MREIQPRLVGECVIGVGETEVTPAAPHLFGLLLALTLEPGGVWSRRGLQELLFAGTPEEQSSHRLRQLLYRLRAVGVAITEQSDGLLGVANPIGDILTAADEELLGSDGRTGRRRTGILDTYAPRLPAQFLDWLERRRAALQGSLTTRRMEALRSARERQDWQTAARLAAVLQQDDVLNEELVAVAAESHAMMGERDAALEAVDRFVRESEDEIGAWPQLKKLRARILAARIPRREGTLRGRTECLAFLADQWQLATSGDGGRACAVFGPPGMGKTRVGETFAAAIRLGGGQVLTYRCDEQNRQSPLAPFTRLVRDLRQLRGAIGADPALRSALEDLAPTSVVAPKILASVEARREELRRAIIDLIEAVSAEQPVLIVIDDAHLLDDPSRAVIRSLADSTNGASAMVLLLCRPRPDGFTLLSTSKRFAAYTLTPLSEEDSRALVVEVAGRQALSDSQLDWAVGHAGGNAFYLHALARNPVDDASLPAHIKSLAQTSYFALSPDARTMLDACLLLDTLASPARATQAAALDDRALLPALRELEEADLLRHEDGLFVGPHAIVRDALVTLIPSTSLAILHRRIATLLSEECSLPRQARLVAWAAVSSWLAAGQPSSAIDLALQVARDARAVGEPEAGAVLLSRVSLQGLSVDEQREVLDEIIRLSDEGKCLKLLDAGYVERIALAVRANEGADVVARLTIQKIGIAFPTIRLGDTKVLQELLHNSNIDFSLRADAAARLTVVAELHFDEELAGDTHTSLAKVLNRHQGSEASVLRANIVFHTSFGSQVRALALADELLSRYPHPSLATPARTSRSYALLCLLRLGLYQRTAALARTDWEFMSSHDHLLGDEYFGSMAAEAHLALGELDAARELYAHIRRSSQRRAMSESTHSTAVYSAGITLAMRDGHFAEVDRLLIDVQSGLGGMCAPRMRSYVLMLRLKSALLRGDHSRVASPRAELTELFRRGCKFGGQDEAAEALWLAFTAEENHSAASALLSDYLAVRRELGDPEWSLRTSTASDPVWHSTEWQNRSVTRISP